MYINKHDGKHMTGDHMKILLLKLPFLLRDLVSPEVKVYIAPDITGIGTDVISDIMYDIGTDIVLILLFFD